MMKAGAFCTSAIADTKVAVMHRKTAKPTHRRGMHL